MFPFTRLFFSSFNSLNSRRCGQVELRLFVSVELWVMESFSSSVTSSCVGSGEAPENIRSVCPTCLCEVGSATQRHDGSFCAMTPSLSGGGVREGSAPSKGSSDSLNNLLHQLMPQRNSNLG